MNATTVAGCAEANYDDHNMFRLHPNRSAFRDLAGISQKVQHHRDKYNHDYYHNHHLYWYVFQKSGVTVSIVLHCYAWSEDRIGAKSNQISALGQKADVAACLCDVRSYVKSRRPRAAGRRQYSLVTLGDVPSILPNPSRF
jgi:hypothetical protein